MNKRLLLLMISFIPAFVYSQVYSPITFTGYNHDVIAEGTGSSSLSITTKEMDALVPSNYIIVTKQFAQSNSLPAAYGVPDNGTITSGTRTYQLTDLGNGTGITNNVVYLLTSEVANLNFTTPAAYTNISLLGTATEGTATINIRVNYTDGTNQIFNSRTFADWVDGANPILTGYGRVKRQVGPFLVGTYEHAPNNPRFYSIDIAVACSKQISSLLISNVGTGTGTSNRAFIFAISGASTAIPQPPVVNNASICPGGNAVLTVQNPSATLFYQWFPTATGGTSFLTGTSYTTPTLNATTTYYVQAINSGGCASARTPVTVTVSPLPVTPQIPTVEVCSGQSATLNITSPETGVVYNWYNSSSGGTVINTGNTYSNTNVTNSVTYYVDGTNASGCKSAAMGTATITVTPALTPPVVPGIQICSGQQAIINVSNPQTGLTYNWFNTASGGSSFHNGVSYTTPTLTSNTTYYVESQNSGGCISGSRTAVTVTILPALTAPVANNVYVCSGSTATLSVTNPDPAITYSWFTSSTATTPVATGTTYTTPAITTATTYYLQSSNGGGCKSDIVPVTVNLFPSVTDPVLSPAETCSNQSATISVSNPVTGVIYSWYTSQTSTTVIHTGIDYTTPPLSTNTNYYVQGTSADGCVSKLITASVTVNPVLATPSATSAVICYNSPATLSITNPLSGLIYNWYLSAAGGTSIFTGITFTTPNLVSNTVYYLEASNNKGCVSNRSSVQVTVANEMIAPVVTAPTICTNQSASLVITSPINGYVYNWYTSATGGTPIASGTTFNTTTLSAGLTLYVQSINPQGCLSPMTTVVVNVLPPVPVPSVFPVTVCTGQSATLTINNPQPGITYQWFTTPVNGTSIASGTSYQTPGLNASTIYYVEANSSAGCISAVRSIVNVFILPSLPVPIIRADTICPGEAAVLSVVNAQAGLTYNWYTNTTSTTPVTTGVNFTTVQLSTTTTWYVDATNAGGCSSARTPVTALVKAAPVASFTATPVAGCAPLKVSFTNTTQNATSYTWNFGDGMTSSQKDTSHVYNSGNYTVTLVATGNGCSDTITKAGLITVVPKPIANFNAFPGTLADIQISFANITFENHSQNAQSFSWQFGDGTISAAPNPRHKYERTGNYRVTLYASNTYGCVDSFSRAFYRVIPDSAVNIPNAFSPNGDGINDTWIIRGISGYTNAKVSIFNRWGSVVYESTGIYKPWNGLTKNNPLATGTFYYVIQLTNKDIPKSGWLMLVK